MFFKSKVKNGKHVYNIENINIKTNLDCMAFTSLLSISLSSFKIINHLFFISFEKKMIMTTKNNQL